MQLQDTAMYIRVDTIQMSFDRTLNLSDIRDLSVATCLARLEIVNGTRLFFDSVVCRLNNAEPIKIYAFDSLSVESLNYRFENLYLDSIAAINISIFSPGTGEDSILASTQDSVIIRITLDSLRIYSGSFRAVPPKVAKKIKNRIYSIPSSYAIRINDLKFSAGNLQVSFNNNFPFFCTLQVTIPELDFDSMMLLTAFDTASCELELAGRNYTNNSDSLTPFTLQSVYSIIIDSFFVAVDSHNFIDVCCHFTDIEIDSLAGTILDTIVQKFSADTIHLHLPDLLHGIETVAALAVLDITNAIAFPMSLHLNLLGRNAAGETAVIDTFVAITPGSPAMPINTSLILNFNRLFNIHPTILIVQAKISAIGNGWINRHSYSTAAYTITMPLRIILHADTISFAPETVSITRRIRELVNDYADSADFYATLQNHLPLALTGTITLHNLTNAPFETAQVYVCIPAGRVDNLGIVIAPCDTSVKYSLDASATKIFTDSLLEVNVRLFLPQTDTIWITARDYFKIVNSYATIPIKTLSQ